MLAQSHRILSGLTVLVMVALVAAGWLLVAQPQLAAASTATDQLTAANAQIATTQASIVHLKSEQSKLPALKTQLAALRDSIPTDGQVSGYIDSLNQLAGANNVKIASIKVSTALSYTPPAGSVTAATPSSTATPAPTPTPTAAAALAAPSGPVAYAPTTDPSITAANFIAIPVTVAIAGDQQPTYAFIKGLQTGTRLFLVSGITSAVNTDPTLGGALSTSIDGYIYVLLDPTAASTATTATATPTPTATPTATTSPSGTATPTPTQSPTPTKKP